MDWDRNQIPKGAWWLLCFGYSIWRYDLEEAIGEEYIGYFRIV
jgi:hypothetical protein